MLVSVLLSLHLDSFGIPDLKFSCRILATPCYIVLYHAISYHISGTMMLMFMSCREKEGLQNFKAPRLKIWTSRFLRIYPLQWWGRRLPTKAQGFGDLSVCMCISGFTKLISSTKRDKNLSRWNFLEILRALAASSRICRAVVQGAAPMEIGGKKWLPIVTYDFLFELGTVTCAGYLCFPCIVGLVL